MNQKTYLTVIMIVFSIIALLHLARTILGWEAIIAGWTVPLWLSWLGLLISGFLAYSAYSLNKEN